MKLMEGQVPNFHYGLCGSCGGNVTMEAREGAEPSCEQCGKKPVTGQFLPMEGEDDGTGEA